jgi:hypothetical protein
VLLNAIRVFRLYKPHFGVGREMSLQDFEAVYSNDVFYSWFGLNTAEVYRAHRLAGGITSLYRQIGVGCERLTQTIVCDTLSLSAEQIVWSYTVPTPDGKNRRISLDAKISLDDVKDSTKRESLQKWMEAAVGMAPAVSRLSGVVFEVRQGYKSKDSKRQQADLLSAANAYAEGLLPVLFLLSNQIDEDIERRYRAARWHILRGVLHGSSTESTYVFCNEVLGYNLADFFNRYSDTLRTEILSIIRDLLT